jgi:hypothetical protein
MHVLHRLMFLKVGVRLARRVKGTLGVAMMFIVHMRIRVGESLVNVLVLVVLGQVQPHAQSHQGTRHNELRRHRLAECDHRRGGANERRGRKICAGACCPEIA